MQNWYQLPKDSTTYPMFGQPVIIDYYKTSEFKRWFAKWCFSGYLLLGIITPLLWIFVLQIANIFELISILCIQMICATEMLYILAYSFDEIVEFLKKKLGGSKKCAKKEVQPRSFVSVVVEKK